MRVMVAGGSGAIGRPLVTSLLVAGHQVIATSRSSQRVAELRAAGAEAVRMDALDPASVDAAVETADPEAIVHQLTSLSGGAPADNGRLRREGTRHLVEAAKRVGVDRIVAQSISWAYAPGPAPAVESDPLDLSAPPPRAATVAGIRSLEEAVAEIRHHVVLRYGTLYGPHTWYAPGGPVDKQLHAGEVTGDPADAILGVLRVDSAVSSFVHVHDAAHAALLALDWPNGAVNVVDDEPAPADVWLPALAAALGAPPPVPPPVPSQVPRPGAAPAGWQRGASNALARSRGWVPRYASWRSGFAFQS